MEPVLTETQEAFSGKWLKILKLQYRDNSGVSRTWEAVKRVSSNGAAVILAKFRKSGEIILVRQYRPPADRFVIEFPAGLIDDGETPQMTAERELKEETGYTGTVISVTEPAYSSPGMTPETVSFVQMTIDESAPENRNPRTNFDEGEFIEIFKVKPEDLHKFIAERIKSGDGLDIKLQMFAESQQFFSI
jgi:8-oxo-dGTP pyrophosphatase MutT (NUDIX family)